MANNSTGSVPVNTNDKPDKVLTLATSWKCKILHVDSKCGVVSFFSIHLLYAAVERELKKLRPVTDGTAIQKTVDKATGKTIYTFNVAVLSPILEQL